MVDRTRIQYVSPQQVVGRTALGPAISNAVTYQAKLRLTSKAAPKALIKIAKNNAAPLGRKLAVVSANNQLDLNLLTYAD